MSSLLIIIPAWNEEQALPKVLDEIRGNTELDADVVVVDDVQAAIGKLARENLRRVRESGNSDFKVVAVTGSVGKTTTKDLMKALLAHIGPTIAPVGSFNNEIGLPLTSLKVHAETRFLVAEMGANHVGEIANLTSLVPPDIAVVLKVGVHDGNDFAAGGKSGTTLGGCMTVRHVLDTQALQRAALMDGKLMLVTNVADLSATEVVQRYKALADIERGFKVLKSEIEIAPVFHRLPERIKAHASICFMALILYRVMRQRLKLAGSPLSPEAALASLRRIQRHSVSIDNGAPVSGISSINQDQAATMAALKVKKLSNELQLSLL